MPTLPGRTADLARAQLGLLTRAQLIEAGWSARTVRRRVLDGSLVAVGARTFRLASAEPTTRSIVLTAQLDRGAVGSHRTAAWLLGVADEPSLIDVSVAKGRPMQVPTDGDRVLRIHSSTNLPPDDLVVVDGIEVTNLARTLLGVAALVPHEVTPDALLDMVAVAVEQGLASMAWLEWMLERRRCRGRNGVAALEAALGAYATIGPTESFLERRFLELIAAAGLPRPLLQRRIERRHGRAARVDFLYEDQRVVVETLGYAFHRTPDQITADTMRANELQVQGFTVLQFTARTLDREPDDAMAVLAAALDPPPAFDSPASDTPSGQK
ncbi:MAG: DUF559 domain-containing protein [Acidimicrobiales bacterium]|nr:DUF559 domain-containing protein [Acidimicrobiales bacterium]